MTVQNLAVPYAIDISNNDAGNEFIDQITEASFDPGILNLMPEPPDGLADPQYVALGGAEPKFKFTTTKLATALAAIGIDGLAIDGTSAALAMWLQKVSNLGIRASGSTHWKLSFADGLVVPRTLDAPSLDELAKISYEGFAISTDGTTHPVTVAGSAALLGTPSADEGFVPGYVDVNGTDINGVQSINIDFGIEVRVYRGDGEAYPTFVAIMTRKPVINFTTNDVTALTTIGAAGAAVSASDITVFLRKVSEGAVRVAAATTEHISFTVDEGRVEVGEISGNPYAVPVKITPTYDGSNAIIVVNTATAIS